jgi:dTDP-glucose 4,6-dehydratase
MITNALGGEPLPIYGEGRQQRDWLFVEDNCRGIHSVLEHGRVGEIYNIASGEVRENLAVAKGLLRRMGLPETLIAHVQDRPGHDRCYSMDCRKIQEELGWKPTVSLEEGLQQTIEWYKANSQWLADVKDGEYRRYYEKYYHNRDASLREFSN